MSLSQRELIARLSLDMATNIYFESPLDYGYSSWQDMVQAVKGGCALTGPDGDELHPCYPFWGMTLDAAGKMPARPVGWAGRSVGVSSGGKLSVCNKK